MAKAFTIGKTAVRTLRHLQDGSRSGLSRNGKLPSIERRHKWRWRTLSSSAHLRRSVLEISERTDKSSIRRSYLHPGMKQSRQNEQVTPVLAATGWSAASFRIRTADGWLQVDGIVRPPFGIDQRATDKTGNRSWFVTHLPGRDLAGQGVDGGRRGGGSPH